MCGRNFCGRKWSQICSFLFWLCHVVREILTSRPGIKQGPQQWNYRVLTTELPGNFPNIFNGVLELDGTMVKNLPANAGDISDAISISGSRRSPGVESGNPLHYSYLENPMDREAWGAAGVCKSWTQLSMQHIGVERRWEVGLFVCFFIFSIVKR